jgi:hypothetical protein
MPAAGVSGWKTTVSRCDRNAASALAWDIRGSIAPSIAKLASASSQARRA